MAKNKGKIKMHSSINISSQETWSEYNKKESRRYKNTPNNWKDSINDSSNSEKEKMLFKYCLENNRKMVKMLVPSDDVDMNCVDADGNTPLMFAVKSGQREVVEYLLKNEAKVDYLNNKGISPLHLAVRKNSLLLARLILGYGADLNITDPYNQTVLFDAVVENNVDMADFLVFTGININHQNREGKTPLMVCTYNSSRQEVFSRLLQLGARIDIVDENGQDVLMHAINNENGAMMDILLKAGANINHCDNRGNDALMTCAEKGNREGLRVLISRGANIFRENKEGQSALDIARECGNTTCYEILAKARKICLSNIPDKEKREQLKQFAKHNRMENSCIR